MRCRILGLILFCLLLTACADPAPLAPTQTRGLATSPGATRSISPSPSLTNTPTQAAQGEPQSSRTATWTPSSTSSPSTTARPLPTITPTWAYHPAGMVTAPILLYHHIAPPVNDSRYYVDPGVFQTQMETLVASGYTTISMAALVSVMKNGGMLPNRPVVITFDDGNLDVYQNAFPVMKSLGMVGTVYIVTQSLDDPRYMGVDVLTEMIQAGWEVGSHTRTHSDLSKSELGLKEELYQSRLDLEKLLNVPVKSISYPFGLANDYILKKANEYGYESGAGLGGGSDHLPKTALYLTRIEVRESYSLGKLGSLLPWWNGPVDPTSTVTPTPTPK